MKELINTAGMSEEGTRRAISQVLDIYLLPELSRRIESGELGSEWIVPVPDQPHKVAFKLPTLSLVILEEHKHQRVLFNGEADVELQISVPNGMQIGDQIPVENLVSHIPHHRLLQRLFVEGTCGRHLNHYRSLRHGHHCR